MSRQEVLSMLRFGCDRIFQSEAGKPPSSADLDAIIDRSGNRAAAAAAKEGEEEAKEGHAGEGDGSQRCMWLSKRHVAQPPRLLPASQPHATQATPHTPAGLPPACCSAAGGGLPQAAAPGGRQGLRRQL